MAWLHNNGDEDEFARFEEAEDTDREPLLEEEGEEEIVVTERAGASMAAPAPMAKPKSKSAGRSKPKKGAKGKKAKGRKAKPKARRAAKKKPAKKAKRGKRR